MVAQQKRPRPSLRDASGGPTNTTAAKNIAAPDAIRIDLGTIVAVRCSFSRSRIS
jgi:hypothetical protein